MNISSLFNSSYLNANTPSISSGVHQFRKDFDQLGQDLQAGNLSAASTDFANLQKDAPQLSGSSSTQNANSFAQEMRQLSSDLQSGNLKAAQQDYTNLQQKLQSLGAQRPHHHHHTAEGAQSSNSLMQDFSQLGQNLQTGDLASAQKAYTSLQQDMQQFAIQNGASTVSRNRSASVRAPRRLGSTFWRSSRWFRLSSRSARHSSAQKAG